ncbi:extracellular solute-binding protein [Paenibacillus cremeus]|uniref:Extracellular solute-binding protein n=2 Tax=Paenibacillus cremeus TaxID=2163881 RepID=A0A559K8X5_9BACL|nr:extracellular solute-binding protein [Paenibacillus cremeus]
MSIVMTGAIAAGCSSGSGSGGSTSPKAGDSGSGAGSGSASGSTTSKLLDPSKKLTFKMLDDSHPSWPYNKDWPVWKWIEEKTGVTLDVQVPSGKIEDSLSLAIASGSMPDIMYSPSKSLADKYGQQGALANILDYVNDMPNFKKWMDKYPDDTKYSLSADGKMYIFPNQGIAETNRTTWLYREDVFKKNGLKAPTTYDELYTVLKKLKELYPNSYPFSFRTGAQVKIMRTLAAEFGTGEEFYYDYDKKEWRYGAIEDNYKKAVEYMNKFYKEGLIPPDWLTVDAKQWQDLISTNRSFITNDYIGRIDFFNQPLRKDNKDFNLAFMPPPAGPGGKALNAYTHFKVSGPMVASTSKQIKDIMKFMDYFYSEDALASFSWGKEGTTYKVENGKKKFIENYTDVADMRKKTGLSTYATYTWFDYDAHLSLSSPELQKAYTDARPYDDKLKPELAYNEKEMELMATAGEAINKHREENIAKFILGQRSLDEWGKYVDEAKKLGVDKVLEADRAAFQRMSNAKIK